MPMKRRVLGTRVRRRGVNRKRLVTIVGGSEVEKEIKSAVTAFGKGLENFLFPEKDIPRSGDFAVLAELKPVYERNLKKVIEHTTSIIQSMNVRAREHGSARYAAMVEEDEAQWAKEGEAAVSYGVLACVDQGLPKEALAGFDGAMGRTLAGDIAIRFFDLEEKDRDRFIVTRSGLKKRLIHAARLGGGVALELLVEHRGCGRRGQMSVNLNGDRKISQLFEEVFEHVECLADAFGVEVQDVAKLKEEWERKGKSGLPVMLEGGANWPGVVAKVAQREALNNIEGVSSIVAPIELYDKADGNVFIGVDQFKVLTDSVVINEGGFTENALEKLVKQGDVFSLKHEVAAIEATLNKKLSYSATKDKYSFEDLQNRWLEVLRAMVTVTADLWELYREGLQQSRRVVVMVERFLELALKPVEGQLERSGNPEAVRRRLTHQLFQALSYAWVTDTFKRGHPPGLKHIEEYLATGDPTLGVMPQMPLSQGDVDRPSAEEMFTEWSVLLHSEPIKQDEKGKPIPLLLQLDTERTIGDGLTSEETFVANSDFEEFLKLWPYFVVGDIFPVVLIRSDDHGGVERLGLSVVKNFGNIVQTLKMHPENLPSFAYANTGDGRVVQVPAMRILKAGLETSNLNKFRDRVTQIAEEYDDEITQTGIKRSLKEFSG